MDLKKLAEANKRFDQEFVDKHPDFVRWWSNHPHCDPDPQYRVAARVAYKCASYHDEFLSAKEVGAT
jgi:hypothetical protein